MVLYPKTLAALGVAGFILVVPPVRQRFDNKVFRHIRNWNHSLNNPNKFVTQEEFHGMLSNVGKGLLTIYKSD